ncbi:hypothetical protein B0H11DRAFT_279340 [Mycena galericulata]|nr:hypothetical protein B0H11DRAFT_279340 [Mycena galericulata]
MIVLSDYSMASPQLPPELWLQVLPNLPRNSLCTVSLVSHRFHGISAPLLFAKFQYRPGALKETLTGTFLQRELERLAFWSSESVAPYVRTCVIALFTMPITLDSPWPLMKALSEAISRFTNLRVLSCNFASRMVELPALRLEKLAHLVSVEMHGHRLSWAKEATVGTIQVPKFSYTDIGVPADSRPSCLAILNPSTLRFLELSAGSARGLEHFLGDTVAMAACHNLRTLKITFKDTDLARIHACIAPFPAIRELIVDIKGTCHAEVTPSTPLAPLLDHYKGPVELLPLVLNGAEPASLVVSRAPGSVAAVLDALRTPIARPDWITSLRLGVELYADIVDGAILRNILVICPRLSNLTLDISSDVRVGGQSVGTYNRTATLGKRLTEALRVSTVLQSLTLCWRLDGRDSAPLPDRVILRAAVPSLQQISLYIRCP